ncbi:MAG TPA: IPExxxVDY family protein [Chitinophagales bacterium]|nr:IPExxxVDY family protein [Chitinophagales bacterium]MCB9074773.1 IPExxxVDY family protein [Chitinophagales bacterium]HMU97207.1 IPExxxVDY family protein [Chitinophagales bacterium]HMV03307.1 IPExxxVDY family protein [Chitinophagales bacterium]HMW93995.1 IPExxxVDY family protein [Chitinophagales bacterium]
MAKTIKHKIDGIDFNFHIWGINSPLVDYRLCWLLNNLLDWNFERVDDIEISSEKDDSIIYFNAYKYENKEDFYTVEIIQNKNDGFVLLPELRNIDYLFIFDGEEDYFDKDEITPIFQQIQGIQSIFEIEVDNLKSKYKLLMRHFNDTK